MSCLLGNAENQKVLVIMQFDQALHCKSNCNFAPILVADELPYFNCLKIPFPERSCNSERLFPFRQNV